LNDNHSKDAYGDDTTSCTAAAKPEMTAETSKIFSRKTVLKEIGSKWSKVSE
jgi:hypothetical protein